MPIQPTTRGTCKYRIKGGDKMTLPKMSASGQYERHPFLTADNVAKCSKYIIVGTPRIVETKYNPQKPQQKCFVDIKAENGTDVFTYAANKTSYIELSKQFGFEEQSWIGKTIELEFLDQVIEGKRKKVIYVKGSLK